MSRRVLRPAALASLVVVAGLALWLFAAGASGDRKSSARAAQAGTPACTPVNPQPVAPLELNSVEVDGVVKTIAMEKELFNCTRQVGDSVHSFVRDLETYIEIIERGTATDVTTVGRRVQVTTCDSDYTNGIVTCDKQSFTPTTAPTPLGGGCNTSSIPGDPVEMNTVPVHDNSAPANQPALIKTIKVDKLIAGCNDNTFLVDLYTFTELIETRTGAAGTASYGAPSIRFDGIACQRNKTQGIITGCKRWVSGQ